MSDSPREVFFRLSEGISDGRWTELGDLYAEDCVVEHPQRPPAGSRMTGRKAVADRFAATAGSIELKARDVVVHETTDPELVVAEFAYHGRHGERTFRSANVQVLRVRDGLIVHSRDYHDYLKMAAARDGLDALAAQYAPGSAPLPTSPEVTVSAPGSSPRGIIERLLHGVTNGEGAALAGLYAEDCHVTHPFHPTAPVLTGRDELRAHFAPARGARLRAHDLVTYQGQDPELIVSEFRYADRGGLFVLSNLFVTYIRDGLITRSRDYGDHLALAAGTSTLPELLDAARAA
ncbi:nuclear transport factor 2 family protein [Amycolatopsis cynarae]|uniref:Nuclear transport factor 2 family protein n=1 Tax=Amycolatopsis cynarae TaxID=2995223 RepID=A0ABY7AWG0_9PSEU|nr:nuclear transport factor 2 family protein [Amycolatopsis sp. HUAS 11-8]WAL64339.1 nuclear transport factor 2 family protein [Amycolatopsis sp. HUAS 11-8]